MLFQPADLRKCNKTDILLHAFYRGSSSRKANSGYSWPGTNYEFSGMGGTEWSPHPDKRDRSGFLGICFGDMTSGSTRVIVGQEGGPSEPPHHISSAVLLSRRKSLRHVVGVERWHWVFWVLKVWYQIVRCTAGEALNTGILYDGFVEVGEREAEKCRRPTVIPPRHTFQESL